MIKKYSTSQINIELTTLNKNNNSPWKVKNGKLNKVFIFPSFIEAFEFMKKIAIYAEEQNHHPEWFNSYNKIDIDLTTHEVNGISVRDFRLAKIIDTTAKFQP